MGINDPYPTPGQSSDSTGNFLNFVPYGGAQQGSEEGESESGGLVNGRESGQDETPGDAASTAAPGA